MIPDLSPLFTLYESLVAEVDAVFTKVNEQYPQCVTCKPGCSDCCYAMFDLSLIEAMYINHKFSASIPYGSKRSAILNAAATVDREMVRLKKQYFLTLRDSQTPETATQAVMEAAAKAKVRCPLLGQDDTCLLYDARPLTCRLYGIPTNIGGKGHVCGKSGFKSGEGYPSVHIDRIQERLDGLSLGVQNLVKSRFKELHKVYVPVSMALLTKYDKNYLGISPAKAGERTR